MTITETRVPKLFETQFAAKYLACESAQTRERLSEISITHRKAYLIIYLRSRDRGTIANTPACTHLLALTMSPLAVSLPFSQSLFPDSVAYSCATIPDPVMCPTKAFPA